MRHTVTVATSPLNCIWIQRGSRRSLDGFEYAMCERLPGAPRVVNEAECGNCPSWESARHRAARDEDLKWARAACDTLLS